MENLIFSLNATIPVFLLMVLGYILRRLRVVNEPFVNTLNSFNYKITLPVLLFRDIAESDFMSVWDTTYVLYCFLVTLICIVIIWILTTLCYRNCSQIGEFIQASYRSSAALLGIAFIQNIYGTSGMAPLMIIGSVPLYNIMAVVVLSVFRPGQNGMDRKAIKKTLKGIVTNPIIIGIAAGLLWSALQIPIPHIMEKTVTSIAGVATPMGLMAMGATFDIKKAFAKVKPTAIAALIKLVGFCAIFLPLAVQFGFRQEELVAILVMLGSATTVSSFVMAKNMGHEGVLSSSVVMLTTLFSAFTLTGWLYVLRSMSLI